ncbi:GRAS domain-containing protein [Cephalotus follicularis]|uniref:GRAS domain-containing protein n=1 Tax=Cephalotus follicularis TaxID=3775 RepID=A0A1Q3C4K5_CEPFO|nr:GRAS domain-containing protein [Cephalotus follicularis]
MSQETRGLLFPLKEEMAMDKSLRLCDSAVPFKIKEGNFSVLSKKNLANGVKTNNTLVNSNCIHIPQTDPISHNVCPSSTQGSDGDTLEDYDFSDVVIKYINQILMEEDVEEKTCMFQESSLALQAAEKSLYDLIGEKYPPLPNYSSTPYVDHNCESPDENYDLNYVNYNGTSGRTSLVPGQECKSVNIASRPTSQSSYSSANGSGSVVDQFVDSPVSTLRIPEIFSENDSVMQFKRGFEEASKFIPTASNLLVDFQGNGLSLKELKVEVKNMSVQIEKKHENEYSLDGLRRKKNPHPEDVYLDGGRRSKQSAVYTESTLSSAMFDRVLLFRGNGEEAALREYLQNGKLKGSSAGQTRGKKQGKTDTVDLRTLLTLCAQAVATDDRRTSSELLKQIRQHSSPTGDGMQRMSHYFADGLEARLAGSGTQIYKALITQPTSAADVLKAYQLHLAVCPFRKLSNFFANKTIMNVAEKATRLHIVDFGTLYGFQWPCLIERLSSRTGGPPRLRITGIDLPQPGFRPAERVEETGRRLANYAKTFKVPFEFNAIAQKWDTIQIEDLKIESGEVLVVNCLYRLRYLLDESVVSNSPRNIVLNLIRKMNPDVFILGVRNGAYSAPFFISRFREALFHFSTLFDILETTVPPDIPERMLIEKEIIGRGAMNVIACEGAERIERPETYKQWQARNNRAGFTQLPLDEEIKKIAKEKVKMIYHKDFETDEDGQWLLQGWKGRIVYALSSWRPTC